MHVHPADRFEGVVLAEEVSHRRFVDGQDVGSVVAEILGHLGGVASQRVIRTGKGIVAPDAVGEKGGAVEREEVGLGGLAGHQHQGVEVTPIVQNDGHQVIRGDAVPHAMLVR